MNRWFAAIANRLAAVAGRPFIFVLALAVFVIGIATGPFFAFSETWQQIINIGMTIIVFLMVFLIQRRRSPDTAAIKAKLDLIMKAVEHRHNQSNGSGHLTDTKVEEVRRAQEEQPGEIVSKDGEGYEILKRLLDRH